MHNQRSSSLKGRRPRTVVRTISSFGTTYFQGLSVFHQDMTRSPPNTVFPFMSVDDSITDPAALWQKTAENPLLEGCINLTLSSRMPA